MSVASSVTYLRCIRGSTGASVHVTLECPGEVRGREQGGATKTLQGIRYGAPCSGTVRGKLGEINPCNALLLTRYAAFLQMANPGDMLLTCFWRCLLVWLSETLARYTPGAGAAHVRRVLYAYH